MSGTAVPPGVDARSWWRAVEPVHAVTYFAPECAAELQSVGLRGFWMGYFAARAAPLGCVGPGVVEAAFFNFHPSMIGRSLPDAWALADRAPILAARRQGAARFLRRVCPDLSAVSPRLVALLSPVVELGVAAGRPLFAANRSLDAGDDPVECLWQHCTTLREHRGDGHVAALTAAGLSGCETLVLFAATEGIPDVMFQKSRGWSSGEWAVAVASLTERRLVADGRPTEEGNALRVAIEEATDRLAAGPYRALDANRRAELLEGLQSVARSIVATGVIPFPNPMGFPAPGLD